MRIAAPRRSLITRTKDHGSAEYDICGLKYLDKFFAGWKVADMTVDSITAFKNKSLAAGANGSTINRSLALLSRMLNLAVERGKLQVLPYIPRCAEGEPRQGYCSLENFAKLLSLLPQECRLCLKMFRWTGARPSELERIDWDMVDLGKGVVHLQGAFTKTGHARTLPLTPDLVPDLTKMFRHDGPVFDTNYRENVWEKITKAIGLYSTQIIKGKAVRRPLRLNDLRHTALRCATPRSTGAPSRRSAVTAPMLCSSGTAGR